MELALVRLHLFSPPSSRKKKKKRKNSKKTHRILTIHPLRHLLLTLSLANLRLHPFPPRRRHHVLCFLPILLPFVLLSLCPLFFGLRGRPLVLPQRPARSSPPSSPCLRCLLFLVRFSFRLLASVLARSPATTRLELGEVGVGSGGIGVGRIRVPAVVIGRKITIRSWRTGASGGGGRFFFGRSGGIGSVAFFLGGVNCI